MWDKNIFHTYWHMTWQNFGLYVYNLLKQAKPIKLKNRIIVMLSLLEEQISQRHDYVIEACSFKVMTTLNNNNMYQIKAEQH